MHGSLENKHQQTCRSISALVAWCASMQSRHRRQKWVKQLKRWWVLCYVSMWCKSILISTSTKTQSLCLWWFTPNKQEFYRRLHWWCMCNYGSITDQRDWRKRWWIMLHEHPKLLNQKSRAYLCWWFTPKQTWKLSTSAFVVCNYAWVQKTEVSEET